MFVSGEVLGAARFSGTWKTTVGLDLSGATLALSPGSTSSSLGLKYQVDRWKFSGDTDFTLDGLDRVKLSASGRLGDVRLSGSLTFDPIGGEKTQTETQSGSSHVFDWGKEYFVLWVEAKNVIATSSWYICVSSDNTNWTTVSPVFASGVHASGKVLVNLPARYVEVRATTGTLTPNAVTPEEVTIAHTKQVLKVDVTIPLPENGKLKARFMCPYIEGTPYVKLTLGGLKHEELSVDASAKFHLLRPDCRPSFHNAEIKLKFPFACFERLSATLKLGSSGFEELSFGLGSFDLGLPGINFSGGLELSLQEKAFDLSPSLKFEKGPCFTLHASLETSATPTQITGLSVYGIGVTHSWNGVSVKSTSYFDDKHSVAGKGSQRGWEVFTVESRGESCCEGKVGFSCSTYFAESSSRLFDWVETDVDLSFNLASNTTVSSLVVVETTGLTKMNLGIKIAWK